MHTALGAELSAMRRAALPGRECASRGTALPTSCSLPAHPQTRPKTQNPHDCLTALSPLGSGTSSFRFQAPGSHILARKDPSDTPGPGKGS